MKRLLFLISMALLSTVCFSQSDSLQLLHKQVADLQRTVDKIMKISELKFKLDSLEQAMQNYALINGVDSLKQSIKSIELNKMDVDSYREIDTINLSNSILQLQIVRENELQQQYNYMYHNFEQWMVLLNEMEELNGLLSDDLKEAEVNAIIAEINNPTSDKLGFKFTDVVMDAAVKTLNTNKLEKVEMKRFKNMVMGVANIANNPLVAGIVSFNPILTTVTSIVAGVSGFFIPEVLKEGRNKVSIINKPAFSDKEIQKFVNELVPYVIYYETLNEINQEYRFNLNKIKYKYKHIPESITSFKETYKTEFAIDLSLSDNDIRKQVKEFYMYDNHFDEAFDYSKIVDNKKVKSSYYKMSDLKFIYDELLKFHIEYNQIRSNYYTQMSQQLKKADNLPANKDKSYSEKQMLERTINKLIEKFTSVNKPKFERQIDNIKGIYNEIGIVE